jgi:hypothetical protein
MEALQRLANHNGTDVQTLLHYMSTGMIPHQDSCFAKNPNTEPERAVPAAGPQDPAQQQQQQRDMWRQQMEYVQQQQAAADPQQVEIWRQQMEYMTACQAMQQNPVPKGPPIPMPQGNNGAGGFDDSSAVPGYSGKGATGPAGDQHPWIQPAPWPGSNTQDAGMASSGDTVTLPRAQLEELLKGKSKDPVTGKRAPWPPTTSKNGYRYYVPSRGTGKSEGVFAGSATMAKHFKAGTTWQTVGRYNVAGYHDLQEAVDHFYLNFPNHEVCPIHR